MVSPSIYTTGVEYTVSDTPEKYERLAPITLAARPKGITAFHFQDYLSPGEARQLADTLYQWADRVDGGADG
jgi:hypothetical protein